MDAKEGKQDANRKLEMTRGLLQEQVEKLKIQVSAGVTVGYFLLRQIVEKLGVMLGWLGRGWAWDTSFCLHKEMSPNRPDLRPPSTVLM
jgi:hypothetical protein